MAETRCLQERYAPNNRCFGCGPANERGLRIRSFEDASSTPDKTVLIATFMPEPHHVAFEGVLNGGICGALLDCHSNWAAAIHLMKTSGEPTPPCTVTSEFHVKLRRPTPMGVPVELRAEVVASQADRATIEATLTAAGKVTATCRGEFVAVKEGHPAYHRW